MDFETLNKSLEQFKDKMLEQGYEVEFYQNLTYSEKDSLKYAYKLRLEENITKEQEGKTESQLVQEYIIKAIDILKETFKESVLYTYESGRVSFDMKSLDRNSNIWGMVFEENTPYVFIEAYIILNKNTASEYKKNILNQSTLLGERPIKD